MKRGIILLITMMLFMVNTVYASELTWENVPGHHNQSELLDQGQNSSKDIMISAPKSSSICITFSGVKKCLLPSK